VRVPAGSLKADQYGWPNQQRGEPREGSKPPRVSRGEETTLAKAYVLRWFANLVEQGSAEFKRSADGESELRLATGEVYRLNRNTVWRIV
jgi:hypothetical protein